MEEKVEHIHEDLERLHRRVGQLENLNICKDYWKRILISVCLLLSVIAIVVSFVLYERCRRYFEKTGSISSYQEEVKTLRKELQQLKQESKKYFCTKDFDSKISHLVSKQLLQEKISNHEDIYRFLQQKLDSVVYKDVLQNFTSKAEFAIFQNKNQLPVGTILPFYGKLVQVPQGFLLCDGQPISAKEDQHYKSIFEHLKLAHPELVLRDDAHDQIVKLPDLRGVFLRGLDLERGIDPERLLGSIQEDKVRQHTHLIHDPGHEHNFYGPIQKNNKYFLGSLVSASHEAYSGQRCQTVASITNISVGKIAEKEVVGEETRPKNVAVNYIIKY